MTTQPTEGLPVFDLRLPEAWRASKCTAFKGVGMIVTVAISFRNFTVGFEVINGFARGFAVVIGPLWIGFAYHDFRASQEQPQ